MNNQSNIQRPIRKITRKVLLKHIARPVYIGGDANVSIQSMTTTDTLDYQATMDQIIQLADAGCDIVRVAVESTTQLDNAKLLALNSPVPLVADIQFDYKLAIACCDLGYSKIRFNPGNVGGIHRVREIAAAAKSNGTVIRVGANSGSVEKSFLQESNGDQAIALCNSAQASVRVLQECGIEDIVVSLKCSNPSLNLASNRLLATLMDYPLHVGVTESGVPDIGLAKSYAGIGSLLLDGIGDTVRISLTADPVQEVLAAKRLLNALDLRQYAEVISCPTCSRCKYDMISFANFVQDKVRNVDKDIKLAVMGCVVNGPGEAKHADLGIAGGDGKAVVFEHGQIVYTATDKQAEEYFVNRLDALING